jgi:hypothetical protein
MMTKDQKWIHTHFSELVEKYGGRYIAVANEELVAVGESREEVEKISKKGYPGIIPSVLLVPKEKDFLCIV